MRHRMGSSKIKYEHGMIEGLKEFLEKIEPWEEIQSIIPAVIHSTKGGVAFIFRVKYATGKSLKCFAQSGHSIQEVFIVTAQPKALQEKIEGFSDGGQK
jgi:hypothetical protein